MRGSSMTTAPRSSPSSRTASFWRSSDRLSVRSCGPVALGGELASSWSTGSGCQDPGQLGVVGPLEAGGAVQPRRVADERRDGLARVDPVRLAVGVPLRGGQDVPVAVEDHAADHVPGGGDQERVVGPADEVGRADDLPVAGARGEDRERQRAGPGRAGRRRARSASPPDGPRSRRLTRRSAAAAGRTGRGRGAWRRWRLDAPVGQREQQPDDDRVGQQRRAAVADERQGDPGQRDELQVAGRDDERLDPDDEGQAGGEQRPEVVGRRGRDPQAALDDHEVEPEDRHDPDQARAPRRGPRAGSRCGWPGSAAGRRPSAGRRRGRSRGSRRGRTRTSAWTTW